MGAIPIDFTGRAARAWGFNAVLPVLFFGLAYVLMPVEQVFQFDFDEGLELVRASLYAQGFEFFQEIWSDHPPLFSILLAQWQRWFGAGVVSARLFVLSFATLLVWSFAQTLRCFVGDAIAIVGTLMLINSINFLRLSVSVMIGLPALALAMLAVYATVCYSQRHAWRWGWGLLAAIALAISLQIKVFTGFLIPILAGYIALSEPRPRRWRVAIAPLAWLLAIAVAFQAIALATNFEQAAELAQFQFQGDLKAVFVRENSGLDVAAMFAQELDYVILGGLGAIALGTQAGWLPRLPLLWLGLATVLMLNHKPLWYHHHLLLSIPLTWLASYGVKVAGDRWQACGWRLWQPQPDEPKRHARLGRWAAAAIAFALVAAPIKLTATHLQNRAFLRQSVAQQARLADVQAYQAGTQWLFTDVPMYAAASGINTPPEVAVLTRKRVASGQVSPAFLEQVVRQYQPEQFVLARFPEVREPLQPYLEAGYQELPLRAETRHYVKRELQAATAEREGFEPSMEPKTP